MEVHNTEYGYGGHEEVATGIYEIAPRQATEYTYREAIKMGYTSLSASQVTDLVISMQSHYMGHEYDVISRNCNHFANELCMHLVGTPIPDHINRLARAGSVLSTPMSLLPARWKTISRSSNSRSSATISSSNNSKK